MSVEGLNDVFNYLLSYSKQFQKKAMNILRGVNTTNINRKLTSTMRGIMDNSAHPYEIDKSKPMNKYMMSAYSVRRTTKTSTEHVYRLFNKFTDGKFGKHVIRMKSLNKGSASRRVWKFTAKSMFNIFEHGRKEYQIPGDKKKSKKLLVWTGKYGKVKWNWNTRGKLTIPPFGGYKSLDHIEKEVSFWFEKIQEKFLNLK